MIDLHCHSNFSDGLHSPEELIEIAITSGVTCLALTDHDTIDGLEPLHQAAADYSSQIHIFNGIELSVNWKKHVIHILGLNFQHAEVLCELIKKQNQHRISRGQDIGKLLAQCNLKNAYEKACIIAGHERVARPHFAQVIVNEGKAKDIQSAFKKYLARGRCAYAAASWIAIPEAVQGIIESGGQAVIAHPLKYGFTRTRLYELIGYFKEHGGKGIEVVSGDTNHEHILEMAAVCKRFDLLASSGSDFHGKGLSRVSLGKQRQLPANCNPIWNEWIN